MGSTYGVESVLQAILVELVLANNKQAEAEGWDGELEDLRADILLAIGGTPVSVGTPEPAAIVATEV